MTLVKAYAAQAADKPLAPINEAYERTISGNAHYRFVIDMSTL
jgi:D-arabinose 1-dehydrogenase-like Zn-dependent alcohol dehydrogenase